MELLSSSHIFNSFSSLERIGFKVISVTFGFQGFESDVLFFYVKVFKKVGSTKWEVKNRKTIKPF